MIELDINELYNCLQDYQKWPFDFNLKIEDYDETEIVKADACAKLKSYDFIMDFYIEISFYTDGVILGSFDFGFLKDENNRDKVLEVMNKFNQNSFLSKAVMSEYNGLSFDINRGFNNIDCAFFYLDEFFEELNNISKDETLNELISFFSGSTGCYMYL